MSDEGVHWAIPTATCRVRWQFRVKTREEAIEKYGPWLRDQIRLGGLACKTFMSLVEFYKDFGELTLSCWCAPKPCHAEVIAEMVREYAGKALQKPAKQG